MEVFRKYFQNGPENRPLLEEENVHPIQLAKLYWHFFESRQTKKYAESELEKLVWIIGHETKSTKILRPVLGKKLVSGVRWPSGRWTDREQAVCVELGVVAGAVLGNCILIGS